MSLTVPNELQVKAKAGEISDNEFLTCVQESLPYAWSVIKKLTDELHANNNQEFAVDAAVPPTDDEWGQLFRLVASDSMRAAIERRYNVKVAFQNCCKTALFRPTATAEYAEFTSARAQILNQRPELINC